MVNIFTDIFVWITSFPNEAVLRHINTKEAWSLESNGDGAAAILHYTTSSKSHNSLSYYYATYRVLFWVQSPCIILVIVVPGRKHMA